MRTVKTGAVMRAVARMAAIIAGAVLVLTLIPSAFAVNAPLTVSDDVTHLRISKLETNTHEWVPGARMAIIEKDTQKVVAEWTTGEETFVLNKRLDVNKPYVLKELSAPAGHNLAQDVEFYVNASEAEGITVTNDGGAGNAELVDSITINVYDRALDATEIAVRTERGETNMVRTNGSAGATHEAAPKTGDEIPLFMGAIAAGVALLGAAALQLVKRRRRGSSK